MDQEGRLDRMIRNLKFRDLRILVRLGDGRSLQAVGEEIDLGPAAMTKALQEIERVMGKPLFVRSTRSMAATPLGEVMIREARQMLSYVDMLERHATAVEQGLVGTRRIGMHAYVHPVILPHLLNRLSERASQLRLKIVDSPTNDLIGMVADGEIDIAVARVSARFSSRTMRQVHLYREPGVLVASQGHPLLEQSSVSLEDTLEARWVLPQEGTPNRVAIEGMFAAAGLPIPEPMVEIMSVGNLSSAMGGVKLVTAIPENLAIRMEERGLVKRLPIAAKVDLPAVSVYLRKGMIEDPANDLIVEEMLNVARSMKITGTQAASSE